MELIASFQVDHTRIVPGIYVSRVDSVGGDRVTTFDVRMKRPNVEPAIHPNAIHSIEHIVATYLRSDPEWKDRIVYWGPMGCLTGNYLIVKGSPSPQEILPLVLAAAGRLCVSLWRGAAVIAVNALAFAWYRLMSMRKFGGVTGDLAGCFVTVAELATVLVLALTAAL